MSENGWLEYQKLVLSELERHNVWLQALDNKLNLIRQEMQEGLAGQKTDIALLKLKSSLWGGLAGLGTGIAFFLLKWLRLEK